MCDCAPKVFVVDDDEAVRDSLKDLGESGGFAVETFASAEAFLNAWSPDQPGCLVLDLRMPGMGGLELQEGLQKRSANLPVIVVTGHGDVPAASHSFRMGAIDFLIKPFDGQVLLDRIRQALEKGDLDRREAAARADIERRISVLSHREREVLGLLAAGLPNKGIATELGIAIRTVEDHRAHVMEKLKVNTFAELVALVTRWELDKPRAD